MKIKKTFFLTTLAVASIAINGCKSSEKSSNENSGLNEAEYSEAEVGDDVPGLCVTYHYQTLEIKSFTEVSAKKDCLGYGSRTYYEKFVAGGKKDGFKIGKMIPLRWVPGIYSESIKDNTKSFTVDDVPEANRNNFNNIVIDSSGQQLKLDKGDRITHMRLVDKDARWKPTSKSDFGDDYKVDTYGDLRKLIFKKFDYSKAQLGRMKFYILVVEPSGKETVVTISSVAYNQDAYED